MASSEMEILSKIEKLKKKKYKKLTSWKYEILKKFTVLPPISDIIHSKIFQEIY